MPSQFKSLPTFQILGSCNGLLCIVGLTCIFIWNPCTKEYKKVRDVSRPNGYPCSYGFGYDRTIDDYKVIRNTQSYNKDKDCYGDVDIYTLGTSSWRNRVLEGSHNPYRLSDIDNAGNGLFINGALYWKALLGLQIDFDMIVSFDIAKEVYTEVTLPQCIGKYESFSLGKLKECLCIFTNMVDIGSNAEVLDVWMKRNC